MRKLMAVVVLLCSAASASAGTSRYITSYCSTGFDKPAVISAEGDVRIGGKLQKEKDASTQQSAQIELYRDLGTGKKQHVIIFRDRVFWPCQN